jgi:hypothetical protein
MGIIRVAGTTGEEGLFRPRCSRLLTRSCELLPGDGVLQGVLPCRYSTPGVGG